MNRVPLEIHSDATLGQLDHDVREWLKQQDLLVVILLLDALGDTLTDRLSAPDAYPCAIDRAVTKISKLV